jgi:hypothetical protein
MNKISQYLHSKQTFGPNFVIMSSDIVDKYSVGHVSIRNGPTFGRIRTQRPQSGSAPK